MPRSPAPIYVPEGKMGWWGGPDFRERCSQDDKVVLDRHRAMRTAEKTGMNAYVGRCGHWHVGHGYGRPKINQGLEV